MQPIGPCERELQRRTRLDGHLTTAVEQGADHDLRTVLEVEHTASIGTTRRAVEDLDGDGAHRMEQLCGHGAAWR